MTEYKGPNYKFVQDIHRIVEEEGPEGLTNRDAHNPLVRMDMGYDPKEAQMVYALFQLYDEYLRWERSGAEEQKVIVDRKLKKCMDAVREYFLNAPEKVWVEE